jgi:hypothetical protein
VDASHAIQFGKVPMLELDDYIAHSSRDWYQSSNLNGPFDVHLCAYVSLILLMVEWRIVSAKTVAIIFIVLAKQLNLEVEI